METAISCYPKEFLDQVNKKFLDANVLRTSTNQKATINNPCKNPEEWNQISQNPSTWGIHGQPWQWHWQLVSFTAVCCIASPPDCIDSFKPFKKPFWVATTFSSQAQNIATEQRMVNSEQKLQNKQWCTFTNDKRYQLQSNYLRLNTESLRSSCIPPVNTVPHGGHIESLWGKGQGLELLHGGWI